MEIVSIFRSVKIMVLFVEFVSFVVAITLADSSVDVTLNDLKELGTHCELQDNCERRLFKGRDDLSFYTCDCTSVCAEYNTCCVDSEYRNAYRIPTREPDDECLPVYGTPDFSVYMIDKCKNRDIPLEPLCESSAEESNDPFLMIPVTSSVTGKIYKNYFCAVCNENIHEHQVAFWNLYLRGKTERILSQSVPDLMYDPDLESWVVLEEDGSCSNVSVALQPLDYVKARKCKPTIATCA
ncbi:uncharacterized protein NPIL_193391 [Nephila pilipes]|uniref:SMB domain-containing protein n=1 Tax=Nephila pilipes TaxID=299642 RepID=A0A8X6NQR0_NEPPI|nr:uncharacterized protein NPIL_193391 [Nephila pilipes]